MKAIFLFFSGLLLTITLSAQTYTYNYTYDGCGNRTKRVCITVPAKSATIGDEEKSAEGNDTIPDKYTESLDEYQISIFPNPASTQLIIHVNGGKDELSGNISLFSLDGRLCTSLENLEKINTIDLSGFSTGNYILRLKIGNNENTYNIIKE